MEHVDLYKGIVRNLPNGSIWVFDRNLRYVAAGGEILKQLGIDADEVVGKTLWEVWGPEQTKVSEPICRAALEGKSTSVEEPFLGRIYWVITHPILDEDGIIVGGMVLTQDITEHRQATVLGTDKKRDLLLRERALNAIDTGIVIVDALAPDLPITYVNEGFTRLTGYDAEEAIGRNCRFLQAEDRNQPAREEIRKAIAEERRTRVIYRNYRKDGSMFWNELTLYPVRENNRVTHFIGIQHDVTDRIEAEETRKSLEENLFQSRKMEALGLLSAGIAHEFNNLLGGVMNYAQLLIDTPEDKVQTYAQKILSAGVRGRDVTAQLLSFARIESKNLAPCAIDHLLEEVIDVVKASLPAKIQLVTELGAPEKIVLADRTMLHGALFNLCANAIDAMKDTGLLTIQSYAVVGSSIVRIRVQDTGDGIDPVLLPRIFDPFFTTKGNGKGTGLGLAYTRATVESHGGKIFVDSTPAQGSSFTIELPVSHHKPVEKNIASPGTTGQRERILIIEDDENILKSATGAAPPCFRTCEVTRKKRRSWLFPAIWIPIPALLSNPTRDLNFYRNPT